MSYANRGHTAEEVSNGEAIYAFYEIKGLKYEPTERYEGGVDPQGNVIKLAVIELASEYDLFM